jgi:hypothetical protein
MAFIPVYQFTMKLYDFNASHTNIDDWLPIISAYMSKLDDRGRVAGPHKHLFIHSTAIKSFVTGSGISS